MNEVFVFKIIRLSLRLKENNRIRGFSLLREFLLNKIIVKSRHKSCNEYTKTKWSIFDIDDIEILEYLCRVDS